MRDAFSRPLPGLAGNQPVQLTEGPRTPGSIHTLDEWAGWPDHKRVRWMRTNLVEEHQQDPRLRWFTARILEEVGIPEMDYPGQARALLAWVQNNVYYTQEAGESIQSPWRTIQQKTGDCDDKAVLLAALASSIALPNRFVLHGMRKGKPVRWVEGQGKPVRDARFTHIALELGWPKSNPTTWASAETILRGAPLGYDISRNGVILSATGKPSVPPNWRNINQELAPATGGVPWGSVGVVGVLALGGLWLSGRLG